MGVVVLMQLVRVCAERVLRVFFCLFDRIGGTHSEITIRILETKFSFIRLIHLTTRIHRFRFGGCSEAVSDTLLKFRLYASVDIAGFTLT